MAKDEYLAEVGLCFSSRSVGRIFLRKETCKSFFQAQDLLLLRVIYIYRLVCRLYRGSCLKKDKSNTISLDGRGSVRAHRLSLTRTSLKSFAHVYDDKSVQDCLSVN